ncbi:hypothetical protein OG579_16850 [Williamsia herbipolensis]|uniref:CENP-V/GFA domain-containing protein n=1 Tax=Williamsia herbipolensis TaxID=1603258 RepID=A0AAU4JZY0_9NOCA|nr:hypothetical protein [Williamsia herbipolensis]
MMHRPPIPPIAAHRPTVGGLVAPFVNVTLADGGVDFRAQHDARTQDCYRNRWCQLCGVPIGHPIVLFGGPRQLETLQFDEPPMHPECAVYASHACPMVAGRQDRYAKRPPLSAGHRGETCATPGCACEGWVQTPGTSDSDLSGRLSHSWFAFYVTGYALGLTPDRSRVAAAVVRPDQVRAVRQISAPGEGRTWRRIPVEWPEEMTNA